MTTFRSLEELLEIERPFRDNPDDRYLLRKKKVICEKCSGTGVLFQYAYHKNGKCFVCNGKGKI